MTIGAPPPEPTGPGAVPADPVTAIVARQYSAWVYPRPIPDMQAAIAGGYFEFGTPSLFGPLLWPEGRSLDGLRVLIAGCGSNQAAYHALSLPGAQVTAIDISINSLQHSQFLKEKHGLDHLRLRQMGLLDIPDLGEQFDYIVCTGVLHHLPDPDAGLRALRAVLAPEGMMNLMLYGQSLRLGVYMLQEVFRTLGCGQTPDDVALVRATLDRLPDHHVLRRYLAVADDLQYDAGIVDTFLHPQDRAYTVPQVLAFARDNGLGFWGWTDARDYDARAVLGLDHPALARIQALPPEQRWATLELLSQDRGTHRFLLCHPERLARRPRFDTPGWLDYVPQRHPHLQVTQAGRIAQDQPAQLQRGWHTFALNRNGSVLLACVDGRRSIRQVLQQAQAVLPELGQAHAQVFFQLMHDWGHVLYTTPGMVTPDLPAHPGCAGTATGGV